MFRVFSSTRRLKAALWLAVASMIALMVLQMYVPVSPGGAALEETRFSRGEQPEFYAEKSAVTLRAPHVPRVVMDEEEAPPPEKVPEEQAGHPEVAPGSNLPCTRHVDKENVHVVIMADVQSFIGMLALTNSIMNNTESDVTFHFVTFPSDAEKLRRWIRGSRLRGLSHEIIELSKNRLKGKYLVRSPRKDLASPMNFARILLPDLLPCVGRVIFIDADCLVLGDIRELYDIPLNERDVAAGVNMCDFKLQGSRKWPTLGLVANMSHPEVQRSGISRDECMMNGGMYLADLMLWDRYNISQQLQYWMELNTREPVFRYGDQGSGTQAVLNFVLHDKYTAAPKEWNAVSASHKKIVRPKLIHWNGSVKPWTHPSITFYRHWMNYYVPDPEDHIRPRNVWREKLRHKENRFIMKQEMQ